MFAGSRWRIVPLVTLLAATSPVACSKQKGEKVVNANPAQIKQKAEAARKSLDGLETPLSELSKKFAALRQQFDKLPPDLPEFGETRGRFYAASIGQGTMTAKVPWLSSRIDSAVKSQNEAELDAISKEIAHTHEEVRQADRLASALSQEVQPFSKKLEELRQRALERRAGGKLACE